MSKAVRIDLTEYLPTLLERMENPATQGKVPRAEPIFTFGDWIIMVSAAICWLGLLTALIIL